MKKHYSKTFLCAFITAFYILFMVGCDSTQDRIYDEVVNGTSAESSESTSIAQEVLESEEPQELVIRVDCENHDSIIWQLSQLYMRDHPEVTIRFQSDMTNAEFNSMTEEEYLMALSAYNQHLMTELASGEADYIGYGISSDFDTYKMAKSGVLLDLQEFFYNDPEIDPNDYFLQALEAFRADGKLTSIPINFNLTAVYFNRLVLDRLGVDTDELYTANCNDILDWYEAARETQPDLQFAFSAPSKRVLYLGEAPRYIDLDKGEAYFDSPEFITFLKRTAAVLNEEPAWDPQIDRNYLSAGEANQLLRFQQTGAVDDAVTLRERRKYLVENCREAFCTVDYICMINLCEYQEPMEYMVGPVLFSSTNGYVNLESMTDLFLPSSIKNPDLAWDFIKFCIGEQEMLSGFERLEIPLNKKTFQNHVEYIPMWCGGVNGFRPPERELDPEVLLENMEKALSEMNLMNSQFLGGADVSDFLIEFFDRELTTPEQCAKKIQDRVNIWVNE